jgi:carbamoyltransferase
MSKKPVWIAGIARGHNSGVCLLKDGEVVFSVEEERLSRQKYDGGPFASMVKILEYTDKIDYLVVAHTQSLKETAPKVDYTGDDVYTGLARKLGLINRKDNPYEHSQVIDLSFVHHKLHAALAFYRSGFEKATAVVVDGAGTFIPLNFNGEMIMGWETETIFSCDYPGNFKTLWKHIGVQQPSVHLVNPNFDSSMYNEDGTHTCVITDGAGITKVYEAVTEYCGFSSIEAGKTMGLFPYGKENDKIPPLFSNEGKHPTTNRQLIIPNYPNGAMVNRLAYDFLEEDVDTQQLQQKQADRTQLTNRRDLAYACQTQTQEQVTNLIRRAVEMTGEKNIVVSGGYALNCVANYHYLEALKDEGINLYVEPVSNDAGTAMGAAMFIHRSITQDNTVAPIQHKLYLGPTYNYKVDDVEKLAEEYEAEIKDATYQDVVDLIDNKNIVAMWQGQSENGPRALGNRSILYDPRDPEGKDHVNTVKHREYFRPFAGTILEEDTHKWFDLRGMESSPSMMYAVNCQPGIEQKIPAIIHVDGTCRIQTVNKEQNEHFYNLISAFKEKTGVPILFNTSFNLGGEPLVEDLVDAFDTIKNSDIEYLYLPEHNKLITMTNE